MAKEKQRFLKRAAGTFIFDGQDEEIPTGSSDGLADETGDNITGRVPHKSHSATPER